MFYIVYFKSDDTYDCFDALDDWRKFFEVYIPIGQSAMVPTKCIYDDKSYDGGLIHVSSDEQSAQYVLQNIKRIQFEKKATVATVRSFIPPVSGVKRTKFTPLTNIQTESNSDSDQNSAPPVSKSLSSDAAKTISSACIPKKPWIPTSVGYKSNSTPQTEFAASSFTTSSQTSDSTTMSFSCELNPTATLTPQTSDFTATPLPHRTDPAVTPVRHKTETIKLIDLVSELRVSMRQQQSEIKDLKSRVAQLEGNSCLQPLGDFQFVQLQTVDDIVAITDKVNTDPVYRSKLIQRLSMEGGDHAFDCLEKIAKAFLSNELMRMINISGQRNKFALRPLDSIFYDAVRKRFPEALNDKLKQRLGIFLTNARDREGGRKQRNSNTEASTLIQNAEDSL